MGHNIPTVYFWFLEGISKTLSINKEVNLLETFWNSYLQGVQKLFSRSHKGLLETLFVSLLASSYKTFSSTYQVDH